MKILCFAPHSAIWVHAFPEALIAEALQQSGHEIVYVTCGGVFNKLCVSMGAYGVGLEADSQRKKGICKVCTKHAQVIRSEFGFDGVDLAGMLTAEDRAWTTDVLRDVSRENFLTLKEDGVELGKIALSHFLMNHKKSNLEFSEHDWRRYLVEVENTLLAFAACRRILDVERPDRVMVYGAAYSVHLVCCELARLRGIPHYYLAAAGNLSNRLQRIVFARGHAVDFQKSNIARWPAYRDRAVTDREVQYTVDHILELLRASSAFVYSSPSSKGAKDIRGAFGVQPEQKVLLATTSSYDEIFASQITGLWPADVRMAFADALDWLRQLLSFVEKRPELFLIIRIHPREFPNKRDNVKSDHASQLEKLLSHLPANVKVNWPQDRVSLYDLARIADVVLNAWSSAGKELALFGIPVVTYAPDLLIYPDDLNYVAITPSTYFGCVEAALRDGWSAEWARRAFRWYAMEYHKAMLDLSESYGHWKERPHFLRLVARRLTRMAFPTLQPRYDCKQRAASLSQRELIDRLVTSEKTSILDLVDKSSFPVATLEEETESLRKAFRRLMVAMYGTGARALDKDRLSSHWVEFVNGEVHEPERRRSA